MTLNVLFCRRSLRISQVFKYWQYRTEIVRILRSQINSAFAFLYGASCAAWANAFRLRVGVRLYNEDDARLYALLGRIVQYDGKYASKMRTKP